MNVTLSTELADALNKRAQQRQVAIEELLREAVTWYLHIEEPLLDELRAWQEVREEALDLVERTA